MADENPIGDQAKKQSPAKQTATPPKPKEAAPAGSTPKQPQSGAAPKSGASSTAPKAHSTKQAKPAADQAGRDDAKTAPRPAAAAPRPASLAKPGSGPADSRPGSTPGRDAQRGPGQPANGPQGDRRPAQQGSANEGDSTYSQRVFDPTASDTVPGRGGRVVGPAAALPAEGPAAAAGIITVAAAAAAAAPRGSSRDHALPAASRAASRTDRPAAAHPAAAHPAAAILRGHRAARVGQAAIISRMASNRTQGHAAVDLPMAPALAPPARPGNDGRAGRCGCACRGH